MTEHIKVSELLVRALGAGVKGKRITGTVGRYMEVAFVHLSKKDPHISAKNKLINQFNDALTQADKLNLPIAGAATSLRDLVEGRGFVDSHVGSFILAYGRFEGKFGTTGPRTCQLMRTLATEDDYLDCVSNNGETHRQPAPYAIRNWLAHIGSSRSSYSENDLLHARQLLTKWTEDSS